MNKTVLWWSAGLALVAVASYFAPAPWSLLCPVALVVGWPLPWLAWGRVRPEANSEVRSASVELPPVAPAPPVVEVREVVPPELHSNLQRHRASLEVLRGLKGLVVSDTEAAVLRLTEALFTLVGNSKDVSAHIERTLGFLTDGESGLKHTVVNLEAQVRVFEALAGHFSQLRRELGADIEVLTQTVGSINTFSETLSDLADQTNVLAINASIEAARVGIHGRGFAVIAGHVQGLARNSKEIADKMARTVQEVVASVEASFARQTERIRESDELIVRSEKELRRWADHVGPQLGEVGTMVADARRLAEVVTSELNDVTVSLQFQDRTRQILDHMAEVLEETSSAVVGTAGLGNRPVPADLQQEVFRQASRHFTVKEEWDVVSLGPSTGKLGASVELF